MTRRAPNYILAIRRDRAMTAEIDRLAAFAREVFKRLDERELARVYRRDL